MNDTIQVLYGHNEIKIKPPCIIEKIIKRRFWFDKIEYWVELEYISFGPYYRYIDAQDMMFTYAYYQR